MTEVPTAAATSRSMELWLEEYCELFNKMMEEVCSPLALRLEVLAREQTLHNDNTSP